MDKNREILVDLIASKTCFQYSKECMLRKKGGCSVCYCGFCRLGTLVDHLVDNGVRVQNPQAPIKHVVDTEGIRIGNAIWRSGTTVYKCPQCGNFISRLYDHCYKCGQTIDWSNVRCATISEGKDTDVPTKHGDDKGVDFDQFNKWIPVTERLPDVERLIAHWQSKADELKKSVEDACGEASTVSTYKWMHSLWRTVCEFVADLDDLATHCEINNYVENCEECGFCKKEE